MSKRELKPNYQMLFDSAVHGLQIAYNEYKKLLFEDRIRNDNGKHYA